MDSLNSAQKEAALAIDGPVVIIAGPGTGKTKTLTERIRFLASQGIAPQKILALTFTKKAAEEMQSRLGVPGVYVATFHGLCFDVLSKKAEMPQFITEPARRALIKKIPKPAALKGTTVRELALLISRAKNMADDNQDIARVVDVYNAELAAHDLCDFDDLLVRMRDGLQKDTTWRSELQKRFSHMLIDEFQDTNALQYELLQLLRGTENICVIGDPLQSIYGFRGADGDIFGRFTHDFPQAKTITLSINYRSAPEVVALTNAIFPDAPKLTAHNAHTGRVQVVEVLNEYSEATWVLAAVQQAIGGSDLLRSVSDAGAHRTLRDFAVLYRSRNAARAIQKACADSGIPYQVVGEGSPYDEPNVQIILQVMAKAVDPDRIVAIKGLDQLQIDVLVEKVDVNARPADIAEVLIETCGFTVDASLRQLCGTLVQFKTLPAAIAYFDDIAGRDFYDPQAEAVTLLTIHASKGLEFSHVFLVGAEEGVLPSARGDIAEERRLFYVAVTRAKDQLDILHARNRSGEKAVVSRFVAQAPPAVLPKITDTALATDQRRIAKRQAKRAQGTLF